MAKMTKEAVASKIAGLVAKADEEAIVKMSSDERKQVIAAAKSLIAADDAAETKAVAEGRQGLTDEELAALGYIEYDGGTWGLPISDRVAMLLVEESKAGR